MISLHIMKSVSSERSFVFWSRPHLYLKSLKNLIMMYVFMSDLVTRIFSYLLTVIASQHIVLIQCKGFKLSPSLSLYEEGNVLSIYSVNYFFKNWGMIFCTFDMSKVLFFLIWFLPDIYRHRSSLFLPVSLLKFDSWVHTTLCFFFTSFFLIRDIKCW